MEVGEIGIVHLFFYELVDLWNTKLGVEPLEKMKIISKSNDRLLGLAAWREFPAFFSFPPLSLAVLEYAVRGFVVRSSLASHRPSSQVYDMASEKSFIRWKFRLFH